MRQRDYRLDDSIGYYVGRTAHRLGRALGRAFRSLGHEVTPVQWAVLCSLHQDEGVSQRELARRSVRDMPTLTRVLSGMVRRGWVRRRRDTQDRRMYRIFLTAAGRELYGDLLPIVREMNSKVTGGLDRESQERLKRLLDKVYDNVEEYDGS